jgi:alkylated DNA repair protein (DNA oxidative demethylase)
LSLILQPGLILWKGWFDRPAQEALLEEVRAVLRRAPLFTPTMPRTGKPFSVQMSNCGPLGWVSDSRGYRYQPLHPDIGTPWPPMPKTLMDLWKSVSPESAMAEACLINFYGAAARMGLHQDRDEADFDAPVVSVSLGATALFRYGGTDRPAPTRSVRLESGDVVVIGGPSRLCFHGIDRLYPGTSTLVANDGRVNLTLRRVTKEA